MAKSRVNRERFKALYPTTPNEELVKLFSISSSTVSRLAKSLGIQKDKEYISEIHTKKIADYWAAKNRSILP
jgi:hypothetical protein